MTTTLTLTADQAGALHDGLNYAVPAATEDGIAAALEMQRKFRPHLELGEQLLAAGLQNGTAGEIAITDTAAALRVVRDLIADSAEAVNDALRSLLDGPECAEDVAEWERCARSYAAILAEDSRRQQFLYELLVELSIRRATEVERMPMAEIPVGEKRGGANHRRCRADFIGEEAAV